MSIDIAKMIYNEKVHIHETDIGKILFITKNNEVKTALEKWNTTNSKDLKMINLNGKYNYNVYCLIN